LAHRHDPDIHVFTVGLEGSIDIKFAKKVARHLGIKNHHIKTFTYEDIVERLDNTVWHLESYSPLLIVEAIMLIMVSECAREHDVKVLLGGQGADEIFAGYGIFRRKSDEEVRKLSMELLQNLHITENRLMDLSTMSRSVEAREPFLDPAVVRYALQLPYSALINESGERPVEKWILREAFRKLLPRDIVDRIKVAMDDGSGILQYVKDIEANVSDEEYEHLKLDPVACVWNKASCYLYKLWKAKFGSLGGDRAYDLFGHYPILQGSWSEAGGTGESQKDFEILKRHKQFSLLVDSPRSSPNSSPRNSPQGSPNRDRPNSCKNTLLSALQHKKHGYLDPMNSYL